MPATADEVKAALRKLITAIREGARSAQSASSLDDLNKIKTKLIEAADEAERVLY
jgi:hypothetical protein